MLPLARSLVHIGTIELMLVLIKFIVST